jgi:hypothetical protein
MNAIPLLIIVIVLLLVYIIFFEHDKKAPRNKPNTTSENLSKAEKQISVIGKTKTSFPLQGTERKPKEANENRVVKTAPENEIDESLIENEELNILFGEDIQVSDESLTTKEIRQMQRAVERKTVSEQEKTSLQKTAQKLRGSDFLEKLKMHEAMQQELSTQLMQILAGNETSGVESEVETSSENWMQFL